MMVVGTLTTLAMRILGIPMALSLGVIAGLFSFVPYIGPVLSALPAILIAALQGSSQMLYVTLAYLIVQLLESYVITPLIHQRTVSLPPAVLLTLQLVIGVLLGPIGVVIATPLGVVVIVTVQVLYVQGVLGDSIHILGQHGRAQGQPAE